MREYGGYDVVGDTITVDSEDFVAKHILECGQVFRFESTNYGYELKAGKEICRLHEVGAKTKIECSNAEYFVKYCDLDRDYGEIKKRVADDDVMKKAVEFGHGIRILKQEPLEMIISFIISANNHIPRIKSIIERICTGLGEKADGYYTFPTIEKLASADFEFFKNLGAGYRDEYLYSTVQDLNKGKLNITDDLTTEQLGLELLRLKGVGRKVADCILLFGYGRTDVYPVDTWIKKVALEYYGVSSKAREYFLNRYKELSGYAQQYIYYYKREL